MNARPALLIVALAVAGPISASAAGEAVAPRTIELQGRCDYRSAAESVGPDTGFAVCNSVAITRNGDSSAIDFRRSLGGSEFRYEGALSGDSMTIARLRIKGRVAQDADGECTIFRRGEKISTVTCVARSGWKTFAANFVASRINP
ncbi:hypothetical protein [Erythrobacter westpacificensis]|uniref:hypothetical protein n=1 Tax=Erythrobacter westpacificensis TaxID=1055231 RepID=UPI0031F8EC0D